MHIHVLGLCGTFMGGLAALAQEAGHRVTGCDAGVYPPMSEQLQALGIDLIEGFGADQMALEPDLWVVGNVVSRARNPKGQARFPLMEAILDSGQPYTSGPQWLGEHVLPGRHVLAVAGTHGKTTTTTMLAWILDYVGLNPGFLIGGVPMNFAQSARLGRAELGSPFVIEADEYDCAFFDKRSKFIHYRPRTVVLNNLEFDHADIFSSMKDIQRQFHHLLRTVPASGHVISQAGQADLEEVLAQGCWSPLSRFGFGLGADYQALGPTDHFEVIYECQSVGKVKWGLSGQHNQLNALAAIAAAAQVGVKPKAAVQALCAFGGVKRRMELRGHIQLPQGGKPVAVYDDFAHHPTAIRTTIEGLREKLDQNPDTRGARIVALFEPRSHTMKLGTMKAQLPWSLENADVAICHAGGVDWDAAEALAPLGVRAQVAASVDEAVAQVRALIQPGDQIVCMSNGSFGGIHAKLLGLV
jgi:UDP-N-acetylmuramate: L-alanyl-gamma-D-glutamyl-meso-diaminopimelate ligase